MITKEIGDDDDDDDDDDDEVDAVLSIALLCTMWF